MLVGKDNVLEWPAGNENRYTNYKWSCFLYSDTRVCYIDWMMLKLKDYIFHFIHADLTKDDRQDVVKKWKYFYEKLNHQYYSKIISGIFFCTDDLLFSTYWEGHSVCSGWGHHRYVPSDWLSGQLQNPHYLVPNYLIPADPLLHCCTYQNSDLITLQFKILQNNLNIHNSTLSCCCIIEQGSNRSCSV